MHEINYYEKKTKQFEELLSWEKVLELIDFSIIVSPLRVNTWPTGCTRERESTSSFSIQ